MSDTPLPPVTPAGDDPSPLVEPNVVPCADSAASAGASLDGLASCDRTEIVEFFQEDFRTEYSEQRKPGPGLPEAIGWTVGVLSAHIAATVAVGIVIALVLVFSGGNPSQLVSPDQEGAPYMTALLGGDQMLVLLATVVAVSLRFRGRVARTLNLTAPHPLHLLAVIGLVLPLSSVSGELYRVANLGWQPFIEQWPAMKFLDEANTVEYLQQIAGSMSLPILLLIIAVGPAFAEELVFRGVIGRGLVARWGLVRGVLITSFLFAAVHMHPVHVAAVVPIGIALHLIYLATRSFWAPVLLHFLNNAWASVASQMASTGGLEAAAMDAALSPTLLLAALTAIVVLGTLLYSTRTRYRLADGVEWSPGYITAEQPPADMLAVADYGLCSRRTLITAGSAWAAFAVAFVCELAAFAR